jgi:hypothetical protein
MNKTDIEVRKANSDVCILKGCRPMRLRPPGQPPGAEARGRRAQRCCPAQNGQLTKCCARFCGRNSSDPFCLWCCLYPDERVSFSEMPVVVICLEGELKPLQLPRIARCRARKETYCPLSSHDLVFIYAGCHGSGKTALTHAFAEAGIPVLDEGFMTMPNSIVHPQVRVPARQWRVKRYQRSRLLLDVFNIINRTVHLYATRKRAGLGRIVVTSPKCPAIKPTPCPSPVAPPSAPSYTKILVQPSVCSRY